MVMRDGDRAADFPTLKEKKREKKASKKGCMETKTTARRYDRGSKCTGAQMKLNPPLCPMEISDSTEQLEMKQR